MSVLARTSGGVKRKQRTLTIDAGVLGAIGLALLIGLAGWGLGARSGYGYAKKDAASIMQLSGGATYEKPSWRGWMETPYAYNPPSDLDILMNMAGGTVPGTGGMTTGDIWSGYQTRMQVEFFGSDR